MDIRIVFDNDDWVIGYFGRKMSECLAEHNNGKRVNVYVPYTRFGKRYGPALEVGYFTHNSYNGIFEKKAKEVDVCICMSPIYERYLKSIGIKNVHTILIPPDEYFDCKLNLAWISHFLWKERKGIELFNKVKELPFVRLIYNEHAVNLNVAVEGKEKIKSYYDSCDYVLITSKFEGGPMSLSEGLKCGKKVICPIDVGIAEVFSDGIIQYKNSDWNSLRNVLISLYNEKKEISDLVKDLTWEKWAEEFVSLIRGYLGGFPDESK